MNGEIVEFVDEVCGVYFRSILLPRKGLAVTQHVHDHDHATYCGRGAAEMVVDGEVRVIREGEAVEVKAGKKHYFMALVDNTRLTCVHNVASADSVKRKGL